MIYHIHEFRQPASVVSPPRTPSPPPSEVAAPGPSQLLTTLLTKLPDATSPSLMDQAAVEFAFLNSKAARRRLVKVSGTRVAIVSGPAF